MNRIERDREPYKNSNGEIQFEVTCKRQSHLISVHPDGSFLFHGHSTANPKALITEARLLEELQWKGCFYFAKLILSSRTDRAWARSGKRRSSELKTAVDRGLPDEIESFFTALDKLRMERKRSNQDIEPWMKVPITKSTSILRARVQHLRNAMMRKIVRKEHRAVKWLESLPPSPEISFPIVALP